MAALLILLAVMVFAAACFGAYRVYAWRHAKKAPAKVSADDVVERLEGVADRLDRTSTDLSEQIDQVLQVASPPRRNGNGHATRQGDLRARRGG